MAWLQGYSSQVIILAADHMVVTAVVVGSNPIYDNSWETVIVSPSMTPAV